jgi:hypothetical protein
VGRGGYHDDLRRSRTGGPHRPAQSNTRAQDGLRTDRSRPPSEDRAGGPLEPPQVGRLDLASTRTAAAASSHTSVAAIPSRARWPSRSLRPPVVVVAAEPEGLLALLVTAHRRPVEQAVIAHHGLETARGGRSPVGRGSGHGRAPSSRGRLRAPRTAAPCRSARSSRGPAYATGCCSHSAGAGGLDDASRARCAAWLTSLLPVQRSWTAATPSCSSLRPLPVLEHPAGRTGGP